MHEDGDYPQGAFSIHLAFWEGRIGNYLRGVPLLCSGPGKYSSTMQLR